MTSHSRGKHYHGKKVETQGFTGDSSTPINFKMTGEGDEIKLPHIRRENMQTPLKSWIQFNHLDIEVVFYISRSYFYCQIS